MTSKNEPKDKALYEQVKQAANKKFQEKSSVYRSSWIVREYKRLGGEYSKPKDTTQNTGLPRWYSENWVDLNRSKDGEYAKCGRKKAEDKSGTYPVCRPLYRITDKTPKTVGELDESVIKKAIREKQKVRRNGRIKFSGGESLSPKAAQFWGKESKFGIMVRVPSAVRRIATWAFELRDLGFKGSLETGWKRAHQLSNDKYISIEDLRYMRNWYARHVKTSYPTYKAWDDIGRPLDDKKWWNRHGIIAWVTWGGDPGLKWVNSDSVRRKLQQVYKKEYKTIDI